jgi:hypothetical protein
VLIPAKNIKHLGLKREVIAAVESGKFTIYGVNKIEEALELLTGVPAGELTAEGQYPPQSIFGRVTKRLNDMARIAAEWGERGTQKHLKRPHKDATITDRHIQREVSLSIPIHRHLNPLTFRHGSRLSLCTGRTPGSECREELKFLMD